MTMRVVLVHLVCFASGIAGLAYEVTWTRLGILLLGATAPAVATVVGTFLGGLGLGAWIGGHVADRAARPWATYARVEFATGLLTLGLVALQVRFPVGEIAWHGPAGYGARVLLIVVMLGAPAIIAGMTLPLVLRMSRPGARGDEVPVASLYAVNTFGAVVGTLATGFWLIEHLGMIGTQLFGVGVNFAVAAVAYAAGGGAPAGKPAPTRLATPGAAKRADRDLLLVAAAIGFGSMALQVVATRALDLLTFSTVQAFSAILAVFLVGIAAGSAAAAAPSSAADTRRVLGLTLAALASWTLLVPLLVAVTASRLGPALRAGGFAGVSLALGLAALALVLVPTLASGAAFPLLCRLQLGSSDSLARGVGGIYLANTVGAVLGSTVAAFVLLPRLGMQNALWLSGGTVLAAALLFSRAPRERLLVAGAAGGTVVLTLTLGVALPRDLYDGIGDDWEIVHMADDASTSVMVARSRERPNRRGLWLNGNYVAGTGGAHLVLAHLPMLRHGGARRLLGACMGTGQTFGAMAEYPIDRMDCVELSPVVVKTARELFSAFDRGLFDRASVAIHIDDARRFLATTVNRYDIVTAEPLQPWTRGTVSLYSREYYLRVREALAPGGIAVQWIPLYEMSAADLRGILATFSSVFASSELWLDGTDVILLGAQHLETIDVRLLGERMAEPRVQGDLRTRGIGNAATLAGGRVMGTERIRSFVRGARMITDADPYIEFTAPRAIGRDTVPARLEDLVRAWETDLADPVLARAARATREFVRVTAAEARGLTDTTGAYLAALALDPTQTQVFGRAAARVARDAAGGHPRAVEQYSELLRLRPDYGRGFVNLSILLMERNDLDGATAALEQALDASRVDADRELRAAALLGLGVVAATAGRVEEARAHWTVVLRENPGDANARAYLARLEGVSR